MLNTTLNTFDTDFLPTAPASRPKASAAALDVFDEPFPPTVPIAALAGGMGKPTISNGIYTLTFPSGEHRTFRIHTKKPDAKFAPGQRIFSMLIGPDNTKDFEGCGFVDDSGIKMWKRFKGHKQEKYAELVWLLGTGCEAEGYSLEVSKKCWVCNRDLTTPESVKYEIGPLCREKIGWEPPVEESSCT